MTKPCVVLSQEIFAVVVAVRRSNHGMDVIADWRTALLRLGARGRVIGVIRRLTVSQGKGRKMVELDNDHWTLDAVVEDACQVVRIPNPCEIRLRKVSFDFLQSRLGMP